MNGNYRRRFLWNCTKRHRKSLFKVIENLFQKKIIGDEHPQSVLTLLKVNNRNTRTRCGMCSKLIIKTPERRHC